MTKYQWEVLQEANTVLESLAEKHGKSETLSPLVKGIIEHGASDYSFTIHSMENNLSSLLLPFWHDELRAVVDNYKTLEVKDTEIEYEAEIEREHHGEYSLSLIFVQEDGHPTDLVGNYENYSSRQECDEDIDELIKLGYKIKKNYYVKEH